MSKMDYSSNSKMRKVSLQIWDIFILFNQLILYKIYLNFKLAQHTYKKRH